MISNSKYVKINSVNLLYLIVRKVNGYFEKTVKKLIKAKK